MIFVLHSTMYFIIIVDLVVTLIICYLLFTCLWDCQEPKEEHLNRAAAADCIQRFLATLESKIHKLGQLWTLREEQRNKNKQLSAEFVQFEKDTREVGDIIGNEKRRDFVSN